MRRSSPDGLEMSGRSLNAEHLSLHCRTPECVQKVPLMIRARGLSSVLLLLPLLSVTCGEETRFFIVQNQVPQEGCSIPGGRSANYRAEGRLDATLVSDESASAYDMYPLLQNDLPEVTGEGAPQPNRLSLKGFHVDVSLASDAPAAARQVFEAVAADATLKGLLSYDEATSGTLEPGGTLSSGVGAFPTELARRLLSSGVFDSVPRVRAMISLRALASRSSGDLDSTEFRYPLEICAGCLVAMRGSCPLEKLENPGNACRLSQDSLVDCCLETGRLRCPAPVKATSMTTTTTTPITGP
jgi:hypothetical protein